MKTPHDDGPVEDRREIDDGTQEGLDDAPPLLSTELPPRADEISERQAALLERLARLCIQRSPRLRWRRRLVTAVGVASAGVVVTISAIVASRTNGLGACCATGLSGALACALVATLSYRLVDRPGWLQHQPWFCPACGYDLAGLPDDCAFPCPECGATCDPRAMRRPALSSADLMEEIRSSGDPDVKWLVKQRPVIGERPPVEIVELLEDAAKAASIGCRGETYRWGKMLFGCLLIAVGIGLVIVGIIDANWQGSFGAVPIVVGSAMLLRAEDRSRRARMLAKLDERMEG